MTTYTVSTNQTLSGTTLFSGSTSIGTISLTPGSDSLIVQSGGTVEALALTGETLTVQKGAVTSGIIISNGAVEVATSATLINTEVASGGTLSLTVGNAGTNTGLVVDSGGFLDIIAGSASNPISAAVGARIEFGGVNAATGVVTSSFSGGVTSLTVAIGGAHQTVVFSGGETFTSSQIGSGSAARDVFTVLTCFAGGTNILTASGERAIDAIKAGDTVTVLRNGSLVEEAVNWVGFSKIDLAHHARVELAAPIRVKAGALAENVPHRDMLLSPEHCLVINDRCVPVKLLVNGASIAREFPAEPFTYYHIELENHGILLAEGAQAESYLDTGNRSSFDNAEMPRVLHPTFTVNANADLWKTSACAPLASVPDEVAPMWQNLAERSVELGMAIPTPMLVENPDLHLLVDGRRIQATSDRNSRYVFMVPADAKSVTLASRFCIPADRMVPGIRDTRRLGVSVDWVAIRTSSSETILSADHPALVSGWNDVERDDATIWRWTDGAAIIPWENVDGSAVLTVRCTPVSQYALYDEKLRLVA